jgi:hypothetical protein
LVAVQLYTVTVYVVGDVLWRNFTALPKGVANGVVGWIVIFPGFWIALLGPLLAPALSIAGAAVLIARRRKLSPGMYWWCLAATVLVAAYGVVTVTPLDPMIGWSLPF